MEETVFFNLGNALASKRDPKELIKEAQIVKDNRDPLGKLVIVEDEKNETHILFELDDQLSASDQGEAFKVKQIIE
ncbi:hypothetical protein ACFFH2_12070 [Enterococcus devriesei]|uniref:Uncharacterized protein n=1 Tax=Enterococcus devriesei TaxID=319970 RepID=A0A1L8SSE3_9ENTE|nr:hypothetical protein [Enterococcus devriesei]MDT2823022.1 hypothetical protein [Enterococcus devriesei]OJG35050.1 hypothetical protein RV00_GL003069 [Enterococcus devriesei]